MNKQNGKPQNFIKKLFQPNFGLILFILLFNLLVVNELASAMYAFGVAPTSGSDSYTVLTGDELVNLSVTAYCENSRGETNHKKNHLEWTQVPGVTHYDIYRSPNMGSADKGWSHIGTVQGKEGTIFYNDDYGNITNNGLLYIVTAFTDTPIYWGDQIIPYTSSKVVGIYPWQFSPVCSFDYPGAPTNVIADPGVVCGSTTITVTWSPSTITTSATTASYKIFDLKSSTPTTAVGTVSSPIQTFTDQNLASGSQHQYEVVAVSASGDTSDRSAPSALVTTPICGPSITGQPASRIVNQGDNLTFTVSASGAALAYQWKKDGTNIAGANGSTLTINNAAVANAGSYQVAVSNSAGSVTSNAAKLAVVTPPADKTIILGNGTFFSVNVTGGTSLSYQWQRKLVSGAFANISPATSSSTSTAYQVWPTSVTGENQSQYRCVVTNVVDGMSLLATSPAAKLTVNKGNLAISWATPSAITYGTPLSSIQLNAYVNFYVNSVNLFPAGSFTYLPASGTVLDVGTHLLTATFNLTDTDNYNSPAPATVMLNVTGVPAGTSKPTPTGLAATAAGNCSAPRINLRWDSPALPAGLTFVNYNIYDNDELVTTFTDMSTTSFLQIVEPASVHHYQISATYSGANGNSGDSAKSAVVTATALAACAAKPSNVTINATPVECGGKIKLDWSAVGATSYTVLRSPTVLSSDYQPIPALTGVPPTTISAIDVVTVNTLYWYAVKAMNAGGDTFARVSATSSDKCNIAPDVDAGPDQTIVWPNVAVLAARVQDDGLPSPPKLTYKWTQDLGPGTVTLSSPSQLNIEVTSDAALTYPVKFPVAGIYKLRLKVSDGELSSEDTVQINVSSAPVINYSFSGEPICTNINDVPHHTGNHLKFIVPPTPNYQAKVWTTYNGIYTQVGNYEPSQMPDPDTVVPFEIFFNNNPPQDQTYDLTVNGTSQVVATVTIPASNCGVVTPVACQVSDWSAWSACTNGSKTRNRTVTTPASDGGAGCPALLDTQTCSNVIPGVAQINFNTLSCVDGPGKISVTVSSATDATSYTLYMAPSGGSWSDITTPPAGATWSTDINSAAGVVAGTPIHITGLNAGGTYWFGSVARNGAVYKESDYISHTATAACATAPAVAPISFGDADCGGQIIVKVGAVAGATSYTLWETIGGGTPTRTDWPSSDLGGAMSKTFTRTQLEPGKTYYFQSVARTNDASIYKEGDWLSKAATAACTPVACQVSDWSAWSACVNGSQTRNRTVTTPASNGGADCPATSEAQTCSNVKPGIEQINFNPLSCGGGAGKISVTVKPASGATSYSLYIWKPAGATPKWAGWIDVTTPPAGALWSASTANTTEAVTRGTPIVITGLESGETYLFQGVARNAAGYTQSDDLPYAATAACAVAPDVAPISFGDADCGGQIIVKVGAVAGATSYTLWETIGGGTPTATNWPSSDLGGATSKTFIRTLLDPGKTYYFQSVARTNDASIYHQGDWLHEDATLACPTPVDCQVSDWSAWSACANGSKTRNRTVTTPASDGGVGCPAISEAQTCLPSVTHCNFPPGPDDYIETYTPLSAGCLRIDTDGSDFDTGLAVYTTYRGERKLVACNNNCGVDRQDSATVFKTAANTTYEVHVVNVSGDTIGTVKVNYNQNGDLCGSVDNGKCKNVTCDADSNVCMTNACNPANGICELTANTISCDDLNDCTTGEKCSGGICTGGTQVTYKPNGDLCALVDSGKCKNVTCDADPNVCMTNACNPSSGICESTANTNSCDDPNDCTTGNKCSGGSCSVGTPIPGCNGGGGVCDPPCTDPNPNDCEDYTCVNNACKATTKTNCTPPPCDPTKDANCPPPPPCDPAKDANCPTPPPCDPAKDQNCPSSSCDQTHPCADPNPNDCTEFDCVNNACTSKPKPGCTITTCSSPADCPDDGNTCNGTPTCSAGICVAGTPPSPLPCNCAGAPICDDGNACNGTETCSNGACVPGTSPSPLPCNCPGATTCDDKNACTVGDQCIGGSCVPGTGTLACNSNNVCVTDSCDPATGCVQTNNTASCSDRNACTVGDQCSGGSCVGGTGTLNCNSNNVCITGSCDPASGCVQTNNTASCDDNNLCNGTATCSNGSCQPGTSLDCDDSNACTTDGCDSTSGCTHASSGAAGCNPATCDDSTCHPTQDPYCWTAKCVDHGNYMSCDESKIACGSDGIACTSDECVPGEGCTYPNLCNPTPPPEKFCTYPNPVLVYVSPGGSHYCCPLPYWDSCDKCGDKCMDLCLFTSVYDENAPDGCGMAAGNCHPGQNARISPECPEGCCGPAPAGPPPLNCDGYVPKAGNCTNIDKGCMQSDTPSTACLCCNALTE